MRTRGCTFQRKIIKVRLDPAASPGLQPGLPALSTPLPLSPARSPRSPGRSLRSCPGLRPRGAPGGGAPPSRRSGREPGGTRAGAAREPERKIPAPPPPVPGFSRACVSYEFPGEGEKFPKCLLCLAFSPLPRKPNCPVSGAGGGGEGTRGRRRRRAPRAGVPPLARGAAGSARARTPPQVGLAPRAAAGHPACCRAPPLPRSALQVAGGGPGMQM